MIKKILRRHPAVSLFIFSFLFMLPSYNKYWAPYDEGNYLTTARLTLEGLVPYKDFLLIMYPPGQAYTMAAILKIFGMNLMGARFYNIILLSIICASVFAITKKVSSFRLGVTAFVLCLITMAGWGEPPIPRPIWPGVAFSLLSIFFLIGFIEKERMERLFISSLFLGISMVYRHDIGILTFAAGSMGLILYGAYKGRLPIGLLLMYSFFSAVFTAMLFLWLYKSGALKDAYTALFVLPARFHKWAAIPFPEFCFDFSAIFHRGCLFIRQNMFYIPIVICAASAILQTVDMAVKKVLDKKRICHIILLLLGIFYLQQLVFRADSNHLAVSLSFSTILFGLIFTYSGYKNRFLNLVKNILIIYTCLLVALFAYYSAEKYVKDIYIKPFLKKDIEPVKFRQGTIYIPDDVRSTFVALTEYATANTKPGEKIYVGHLKHNVPQMGWFDLIYFISERNPAVKYYVMIPGFQSDPNIQEEMAKSLKLNNARVLLLRDFGETEELGPLDKYIRSEYRLDKVIDSYHIYVKK